MESAISPFLYLPAAGIFDVDGVLLASPHERAWREALAGFADPSRFTTALYQAVVAGKPRLDGALAGLEALGVREASSRALAYAEAKQTRLEGLIDEGAVVAFPDALQLVEKMSKLGWPMAVASSSKNANAMMATICLPGGVPLMDAFKVNVCGRDLPRGKPDPAIFLLAATELALPPGDCVVFEDSPTGIAAARAGGMLSIGVARLGDSALLRAAGADRVVTTFGEVASSDLTEGRRQGPAL